MELVYSFCFLSKELSIIVEPVRYLYSIFSSKVSSYNGLKTI